MAEAGKTKKAPASKPRANAVPDEPVSDWWIVAAGALAGLLWAVVFVAVKGGLL